MRKVFISHPFAGLEAQNRKRAERITEVALEAGYLSINPLALFGAEGFTDAKHRRPIMEVCRALIAECDEVWCFGDSPGCREETEYAMFLRKPVHYYSSVHDLIAAVLGV